MSRWLLVPGHGMIELYKAQSRIAMFPDQQLRLAAYSHFASKYALGFTVGRNGLGGDGVRFPSSISEL